MFHLRGFIQTDYSMFLARRYLKHAILQGITNQIRLDIIVAVCHKCCVDEAALLFFTSLQIRFV